MGENFLTDFVDIPGYDAAGSIVMTASAEAFGEVGNIHLPLGTETDLERICRQLPEEDGHLDPPDRSRIVDKAVRQFGICAGLFIHVESHGQRSESAAL